MRKKMIAMFFVLILSLSGCADVSTAPEESDNYELVTGTEAAAEAESTESSFSRKVKKVKVPKRILSLKAMPKLQSMSLLKAKLQNRTSLYRKEKIKYLKQNLR